MAIDFDAIRNKLNQLSGKNRRSNVMWKPQVGEESNVRLLSFSDNDGQPFKERYFYYNIGNNPGLLAPYQFGNPDPIQELITKLRDDGSKESYELAKKLYPKMRIYAPVLVRGEEDKGVRLWAFGKMVYQSILNLMLDEDYRDITDPASGRDIKVTCTKQPGRMWATTDVRPRGSSTNLSESQDQASEWMNNVPNIDDMFSCKTYEELEKIVNDWLNDDDDSSTGSEKSAGTTASTSGSESTATDTSYKSLDDAFADLEDI
jgi:hypothetical protein